MWGEIVSARDGGPAFPRDHAHDGHNGMSLLDYFAAHAPIQIDGDTDPAWVSGRTGIALPTNPDDQREWARFWAACEAKLRYEYARSMLAAREAKP